MKIFILFLFFTPHVFSGVIEPVSHRDDESERLFHESLIQLTISLGGLSHLAKTMSLPYSF